MPVSVNIRKETEKPVPYEIRLRLRDKTVVITKDAPFDSEGSMRSLFLRDLARALMTLDRNRFEFMAEEILEYLDQCQ